VVDADFRSPSWPSDTQVQPGEVDAVLAARALHYVTLPASRLSTPDSAAATPGGIFVNADRYSGGAERDVPWTAQRRSLPVGLVGQRATQPALAAAFRERARRPAYGGRGTSSASSTTGR
jgi:hypothetical protein